MFHELQARGHSVQLTIELARELADARRFLGAFLDEAELGLDGIHFRFDFRRARVQGAHALDERFKRRTIGRQLVAQHRGFGVRLVKVGNVFAQRLEVAAALVERHQLRIGALGQLVHLFQPRVQHFERFLFFRELVVLSEELLEPLRQRVDALIELRDVLVFGRQRVHPSLGFADRGLERVQPLIERLELFLFDAQSLDVAANRFSE